MVRQVVSRALLVLGAHGILDGTKWWHGSASIEDFMNRRVQYNISEDELPAHIRGANFTYQNVKDYFTTNDYGGNRYCSLAAGLADANAYTEPSSDAESAFDADNKTLGATPADMMNALSFAWTFVKDNKPVVTTKMTSANAVPKVGWRDLTGWHARPRSNEPWSRGFDYHWKNNAGVQCGHVHWQMKYQSSGNLHGVGKYLEAVSTPALDAEAGFGWQVDATSHVTGPINIGTAAAPVASLDIAVQISVSGVFQSWTRTCQFRVNGDGSAKLLNSALQVV